MQGDTGRDAPNRDRSRFGNPQYHIEIFPCAVRAPCDGPARAEECADVQLAPGECGHATRCGHYCQSTQGGMEEERGECRGERGEQMIGEER